MVDTPQPVPQTPAPQAVQSPAQAAPAPSNPSVNDMLGDAGNTPSVNEMLGDAGHNQEGLSGPFADQYFNSGQVKALKNALTLPDLQSLPGKIEQAVNPGNIAGNVLKNWSDEAISNATELENSLSPTGMYGSLKKADQGGKVSTLETAMNEFLLRPSLLITGGVVSAGSQALQIVGNVLAAAPNAIAEIARNELVEPLEASKEKALKIARADGKWMGLDYEQVDNLYTALQHIPGGLSEYASAIGSGEYLPEELIHGPHGDEGKAKDERIDPHGPVFTASAEGKVGEGEEGYYNSKRPTPEAQTKRNEAAQFASGVPVQAQDYITDPHQLARVIAPDTFSEYEQRLDHQQELEQRLKEAYQQDRPGENEEYPDWVRNKSPELQKAEEDFKDNHNRIAELEPDIQEAYRHALSLLPNEEKPTFGKRGVQAAPESPVAKRPEPEGKPLEETETETPKDKDTPKISEHLEEKLVDAGVPNDEARAQGKLWEAYYETLSKQMGGKIGTPFEIYQKIHPDVKYLESPEELDKLEHLGRLLHQEAGPNGRLRVARRMPDGKIKIGRPGGAHFELIDDDELERQSVGYVGIEENDMGWATPEGHYLTRQEALKWVEEHNPEVNPELASGGPRAKDKLESIGYEKELEKAGLQEAAQTKLPPHLEEDRIARHDAVNKAISEKKSFGRRTVIVPDENGENRTYTATPGQLMREHQEWVNSIEAQAHEDFARKHGYDIKKPRVLYQDTQGEKWYYHALQRGVENLKLDKASPDQWKSTINNLKGAKAVEVKWSNIHNWLDEQKEQGKTSVTKQEVQDYLKKTQVDLKEVRYSGSPPELAEDKVAAKAKELFERSFPDLDWDKAPSSLVRSFHREAREALYKVAPVKPARFHSFRSPGGEKYEEYVLTAPDLSTTKPDLIHGPKPDWKVEESPDHMEAPMPTELHPSWKIQTEPGHRSDEVNDRGLTYAIRDNHGNLVSTGKTAEEAKQKALQYMHKIMNKYKYEVTDSEGNLLGVGADHNEAMQDAIDQHNKKAALESEGYSSPHWPGVANPVMHIRTEIRTNQYGERTQHNIENQGDWGQGGRKYGFTNVKELNQQSRSIEKAMTPLQKNLRILSKKLVENVHEKNYQLSRGPSFDPEIKKLSKRINDLFDKLSSYNETDVSPSVVAVRTEFDKLKKDYDERFASLSHEQIDELDRLDKEKVQLETDYKEARRNLNHLENSHDEIQQRLNGKIFPETPFANTESWAMLGVKKLIRLAAERGMDYASFDTGAANIKRYPEKLKKVTQVSVVPTKIDPETSKPFVDKDGKPTNEVRYTILGDGEINTFNPVKREDLKHYLDWNGDDLSSKVLDHGVTSFHVRPEEWPETENVHKLPQRFRRGGPSEFRLPSEKGAGLIKFYDRDLPSFVNRYIKQWGAKLERGENKIGEVRKLKDLGAEEVDEIRQRFGIPPQDWRKMGLAEKQEYVRDFDTARTDIPENTTSPSYFFKLPEDMKKDALAGNQPLFSQNKKRGAFVPNPDGRNIIYLFKKTSDPSSLIHESGHQWLENWVRFAQHPDAPQAYKDDFERIKTFIGWDGQGEIPVASHELFARTAERYLRDGVAPAPHLQSVFDQFKDWLMKVYKTVRELGKTKMNPEIKAVFDRMFHMEDKPEDVAARPEPPKFGTRFNVEGQGRLRQTEGTGATKPRGLSARLQRFALERGMQDAFPGDAPTYRALQYDVMDKDILDMTEKNPETALNIALGKEDAPRGIQAVRVFTAMANKALADGDWDTLNKLRYSDLNQGITSAAQDLRALQDIDDSSPLKAIRELQKQRENLFTRNSIFTTTTKEQKRIAGDIKKMIKDEPMSKEDVIAWAKSIECDY